jgi:acyl carrier protein
MYTRDEILEGIRDSIVNSLDVEPGQVREDTLLVQELGLASIDLLDLLFTLNSKFGTYIKATEVQSQLLGGLTEQEFLNPDRTVSERGYRRIAELVPGFDPEKRARDLADSDLYDFFRVRHLVDIVEQRLAKRLQQAL